MRRLMHILDTHLQRGTVVSMAIGALSVLLAMAYVFLGRDHLYPALLVALLGMVFTWREYVVWRRRKAQGGLELIGTSREIER